MRRVANQVPTDQQNTAGVEGYVFDSPDGGQVVIWTCRETIHVLGGRRVTWQ